MEFLILKLCRNFLIENEVFIPANIGFYKALRESPELRQDSSSILFGVFLSLSFVLKHFRALKIIFLYCFCSPSNVSLALCSVLVPKTPQRFTEAEKY